MITCVRVKGLCRLGEFKKLRLGLSRGDETLSDVVLVERDGLDVPGVVPYFLLWVGDDESVDRFGRVGGVGSGSVVVFGQGLAIECGHMGSWLFGMHSFGFDLLGSVLVDEAIRGWVGGERDI